MGKAIPMALQFLHTSFENGSPVQWDVASDGSVHLGLLYDHERASSNRAAGHWHVQFQAPAGTELTVVLENFDNIWNGRPGSPISDRTSCFVSPDGSDWSAIPAQKTAGNRLEFRVRMASDTLYLARLEPYRLRNLERFLSEIRSHPHVEIADIGQT